MAKALAIGHYMLRIIYKWWSGKGIHLMQNKIGFSAESLNKKVVKYLLLMFAENYFITFT